LRPYRQRLLQVETDHNDLMNKSVSYLYARCHLLKTTPILKELSAHLKDCLTFRYTVPLSLFDQLRARRELFLVNSIRYKLAKAELVLRPTDKSGVFHIGSASDYERKAIAYRTKTAAYVELLFNPLDEIYIKVKRTLDSLQSKKRITAKQHDKMMPDREKVHLAYMYFIPKAHKVRTL